jgi:hypothetical protein
MREASQKLTIEKIFCQTFFLKKSLPPEAEQ